MWALILVLMGLACTEEHGGARGLIAKTPAEVMYKQAHMALREADVQRLTWGVTPYVSSDGTVETHYQPTVDIVAERLSIPMQVVVGESYAEVEAGLLAGSIDIAVMSPYAYVRARAKQPGIKAIATHIANGTESYGAYILAREDSDLRSLADLRGKRFGFVDPHSSSGWLFPASRLLDAGMNPLTDIEGRFYGSHAAVISAIASGEVAAGSTYVAALADGRGKIPGANKLRVIARTERIPYDAYVVRSGFPIKAILGLQKALSSVSTRDPRGREALAPLEDINGFVRTDDAHYKRVRDVEKRVQSLIHLPGALLPTIVPKNTEQTDP
jgi:phosphonate transport system substrate-binding protein